MSGSGDLRGMFRRLDTGPGLVDFKRGWAGCSDNCGNACVDCDWGMYLRVTITKANGYLLMIWLIGCGVWSPGDVLPDLLIFLEITVVMATGEHGVLGASPPVISGYRGFMRYRSSAAISSKSTFEWSIFVPGTLKPVK